MAILGGQKGAKRGPKQGSEYGPYNDTPPRNPFILTHLVSGGGPKCVAQSISVESTFWGVHLPFWDPILDHFEGSFWGSDPDQDPR